MLDLGRKPISEGSPAGEDIRYDPDFEQLQAEIDKLSIASAEDRGIDWLKVVQLGSCILAEKSKHLLVAVYLGAGLVESQGLQGLDTSLHILADLVENFWETLFPAAKRMQGRLNAIRWWMERVDAFLAKGNIEPQPAEFIEALCKGVENLDRLLGEKVEDGPNLRSLLNTIGRLPVLAGAAPEPAIAAGLDAAGPAVSQPQSAPIPATVQPPVGEIGSAKDAERLLDATLKQMAMISGLLVKQSLSSPLPYRLNRMAAWSTVDSLPPANEGKTMIPPPDPLIRNSIERLLGSGEFEAAILTCESRIAEFLFWLDLNELIVRAMEMLGPRFLKASEIVCTETALYVKRLPGIENLAFSDGTPFASKETRVWLKSIETGGGNQQDTASADGDGGVDARVAEALSKAQALAKGKKTADAIRLFQEQYRSSDSDRNRFVWQIALSRFLVGIGRPELARPHFRRILDQIERFHLEDWDPLLALNGLKVIYEGMKEDGQEESKVDLKDVLDRIARISPVDILQLLGTG